jgi:hypothetical protein|tara:strand:- start:4057 stop:4680 length:624 start_codon:yes stop_codon:yes gene_type:complete
MKTGIIVKKTGELKVVTIKAVTKVSEVQITRKDIASVFNTTIQKSKNFKDNFKRYCDWELDEYVISIFGSKSGKAGSENKFDLPPPEDTDIYFGELLVIKSKDNIIEDLNKKMFNDFIETSFGGFEDLGSKDTDEDYDPELDRYESDFVVDDDVISYDEDYNPEEEEEEEEEYNSSTNEENELHESSSCEFDILNQDTINNNVESDH